jgi:hypothetical protein
MARACPSPVEAASWHELPSGQDSAVIGGYLREKQLSVAPSAYQSARYLPQRSIDRDCHEHDYSVLNMNVQPL